jgi:hypothetical protein
LDAGSSGSIIEQFRACGVCQDWIHCAEGSVYADGAVKQMMASVNSVKELVVKLTGLDVKDLPKPHRPLHKTAQPVR